MSKTIVDSILYAKVIISVDADSRVFHNHAIIIDDGEIVDIIEYADVLTRYLAAEEVYLDNHIVMPGLVNAHGHAAMSLLRGYADDYELHTWLNDHIWPVETKHVSSEFVALGTELAVAEMLKSGTTTFSDQYFFPEAAAKVVDKTGMRAQFATTVFDFSCAWGSGADDYIHKATAFVQAYSDHPRIYPALGPHAPYTVNDENFTKVVEAAHTLEVPIHVHLHETQQEVSDGLAQTSERPLARLDKLGVINRQSQLVHMTALDGNDINTVKDQGASVIHCPRSNMKLASGFCPTQHLIDQGINVAIGTDGAASNNALDMLSEIQYAALIAKGHTGNATAIDANTALRMGTINGAKALGIDDHVGSIEVGKQADIVAFKIDALQFTPLFEPVSQLVYTQSASQVTDVWVAGQRLLEDAKLTTIDEADLIKRVNQFAQGIKSS